MGGIAVISAMVFALIVATYAAQGALMIIGLAYAVILLVGPWIGWAVLWLFDRKAARDILRQAFEIADNMRGKP